MIKKIEYHDKCLNILSQDQILYIRLSFVLPVSVRYPNSISLISETMWTGEFLSKSFL